MAAILSSDSPRRFKNHNFQNFKTDFSKFGTSKSTRKCSEWVINAITSSLAGFSSPMTWDRSNAIVAQDQRKPSFDVDLNADESGNIRYGLRIAVEWRTEDNYDL